MVFIGPRVFAAVVRGGERVELTFTVSGRESGFALRDFLHVRKISSGLARAVKRAGGFYLNGVPAHTNARVHEGDVLTFCLPPEPPTAVEPEDLPLRILYEDCHAMVLDKPAGQTVHPTRGYVSGTLANAFCGLVRARGQEMPFRPVNRLDKGTSGLVLCALNAWAAPLLADSVQKVYYALVQGEVPDEGVLRGPIALEPGSLIKRCVAPGGQPSVTEYTLLARHGGASLVRCVLRTGRTHQIRVHFAGAGHPLLGDDLYGGDTSVLRRPALHCGELTFARPDTGARVRVRAALPDDLRSAFLALPGARAEGWLFEGGTSAQEL